LNIFYIFYKMSEESIDSHPSLDETDRLILNRLSRSRPEHTQFENRWFTRASRAEYDKVFAE